jgi:hypothetical protein
MSVIAPEAPSLVGRASSCPSSAHGLFHRELAVGQRGKKPKTLGILHVPLRALTVKETDLSLIPIGAVLRPRANVNKSLFHPQNPCSLASHSTGTTSNLQPSIFNLQPLTFS